MSNAIVIIFVIVIVWIPSAKEEMEANSHRRLDIVVFYPLFNAEEILRKPHIFANRREFSPLKLEIHIFSLRAKATSNRQSPFQKIAMTSPTFFTAAGRHDDHQFLGTSSLTTRLSTTLSPYCPNPPILSPFSPLHPSSLFPSFIALWFFLCSLPLYFSVLFRPSWVPE